MKNKLETFLLKSGTGILTGHFRLPVCLISFIEYRWYKEYLQEEKNKEDTENYETNIRDFKNVEEKLGTDLAKYEKHYQNPVINFSTESGTFLGTYLLGDTHDPGSGETEGSFLLYLDCGISGPAIVVETQQSTLNSNWGSCLIYIDGKGEEKLPFA